MDGYARIRPAPVEAVLDSRLAIHEGQVSHGELLVSELRAEFSADEGDVSEKATRACDRALGGKGEISTRWVIVADEGQLK